MSSVQRYQPEHIALREHNFFTKVARNLSDLTDAGCIGKVATFAIYLLAFIGLAFIGSFFSVIGIPLFVLIDREVVLLRLERDLHQGGFITNPQIVRGLQERLSEETESGRRVNVEVQHLRLDTNAQAREITRLETENRRLSELSQKQAEQLAGCDQELNALLHKAVQELAGSASENVSLRDLTKDLEGLKQTFHAREEELRKLPEAMGADIVGLHAKAIKMMNQLQQIRMKFSGFAGKPSAEQARIAGEAAFAAIASPVKLPNTVEIRGAR